MNIDRNAPGNDRRGGFSLIELLLSMAIVGCAGLLHAGWSGVDELLDIRSHTVNLIAVTLASPGDGHR